MSRWERLPFSEIWAVDFEFISRDGERPVPVCMVARELRSGRLLRLWQDELQPRRPPFAVGDDTLLVAFLASAEIGCFLALDWPLPTRVLDLYAEFRVRTNGMPLEHGRGLLGALSFHGLTSITSEEKAAGRTAVAGGGPWSAAERAFILDYCQTDVDPLGELLDRMLPAIQQTRQGLGQALLRGRYMCAVARMEWTGVPIDVEYLGLLRSRWDVIKLGLIEDVDREFRVFEGATFKADRFARWLANEGIAWPCTETSAAAEPGRVSGRSEGRSAA